MTRIKIAFQYIKQQLIFLYKSVNQNILHPMRGQAVEGQAFVEYALLLLFIALAVIGILVLLGPSVGSVFSGIDNSIRGCQNPLNAAGTPVPDQNCVQDINSYPTPTGIWVHIKSITY